MNYRMIRNVLGWILLFEAAFMILPLVASLCFAEWRTALSFLLAAAICCAAGGLFVAFKPKSKTLYAKEGFVIVSLSWIFLSVFGALPFVFSGEIPSYIDALFETASGFTTTGASILTDVEAVSRGLIMWRSFTHWVGGMGVLVFVMAFIPLSGGQNMHIMRAESPGPSVSKLVPRVRTTALILYSIYMLLTAVQVILLLFGGLSFFEALNVAFATAGTGGFGFLNDSLGSFSSYLQIVTAVFMLLFSINFTSYYLVWRAKFKDGFNTEVRVFLLVVAAAVAIVTVDIMRAGEYATVSEGLKHAFFSVSTVISTTGFSTADFNLWPTVSRVILVLLMFIGACAGSTGGGIKVSRFIILFKSIGREMSRMLHPRQVKNATVDGRSVDDGTVHNVLVFIATYVLVFSASVLLIAIDGKDLVTSFTAVAATINNIGPGLGEVGPTGNYSGFSVFSKLVLTFDMLAGRLEVFPMLLLFSPKTWKK